MSNPVSDDLVERLRERSVFMDDADMDLEAAGQIASLSAERDDLVAEKLIGWVETIGNENDLRASEWKARALKAEAQLKAAREALDSAVAILRGEVGSGWVERNQRDWEIIDAALNPKAPS